MNTPTFEPEDYVTKAQLASMLHVTGRTVNNYMKSGILPKPIHVGRRALWSRGVLLAFLAAQQPEPK